MASATPISEEATSGGPTARKLSIGRMPEARRSSQICIGRVR